jgi:hypothetical protein
MPTRRSCSPTGAPAALSPRARPSLPLGRDLETLPAGIDASACRLSANRTVPRRYRPWPQSRGHHGRSGAPSRSGAPGSPRPPVVEGPLPARRLPGGTIIGFPWSGDIGRATARATPLLDCDIHYRWSAVAGPAGDWARPASRRADPRRLRAGLRLSCTWRSCLAVAPNRLLPGRLARSLTTSGSSGTPTVVAVAGRPAASISRQSQWRSVRGWTCWLFAACLEDRPADLGPPG